MKWQLRSKKFIKIVCILIASLLASVMVFWGIIGTVWIRWDFQILDIYYKHAIGRSRGRPISTQIVYVLITDDSYAYFGTNILDRADLARVNDALADAGTAAVAYDIIFARPGRPPADQEFAASLGRLGPVYLPMGFDTTAHAAPFRWEEGTAYERLRTTYLKQPVEHGTPQPFYATRALLQLDDFIEAAFNTGHISISTDADGVFRHIPLLIKIGSAYLPTLSLSIFLDYIQVSFEDIVVDWGSRIIIPASKSKSIKKDIIIPIDNSGRTFIPFVQTWRNDFNKITAHTLLQYHMDKDLRGNLREFFEDKFVFIGDISVGISDVGHTPLETGMPLVAIHAAVLNGLLTDSFYRTWSFWQVQGLICLLALLLGVSALSRASWMLYLTGGASLLSIAGLTWLQFLHLSLLPVVTVSGSVGVIFFGMVIGLQIATSKEQAFIRNVFAKYVPEQVVAELLAHPERLKLGGEERILSVLFADVENFTTIAESMSASELVSLLNEYLTEMTAIILAHGGIIDKYEGDAIMAEFGVPLALSNHAELAVRAGLQMQRRLCELRQIWDKRGLPALQCRIGINTGPMIVGNMGSHQVFDYTVIGDAVNLASRLESANKFYRTHLMIAESTDALLTPGMFRTRVLDVIKVKGKARAVKVYEVYGDSTEPVDANAALYYQTYHQAFVAYLGRDFASAQAHFATALSLRPDDPAVRNILARIEALDPHDLSDDWDGSVTLTAK